MHVIFAAYQDNMDNGDDIQAALAKMTGQRTVPNVFVGEQHLGGT